LIIDSKSLKSLSSRQLAILKNTVRELGLGVFIQPDAGFFKKKKLVSSFKFDSEKSKETFIKEYPNQNLKKYSYQFREGFSIEPIHNSGSKIWSGYERVGSGRVGSTVFKNTFELILKGQSKTYQSIWAGMLEKISKPKTHSVKWNANENLAYKDAPFQFQLRTNIPNPIVQSDEGFSIPLQRDIHVKSLWKGKVYPREVGWKQQFVTQDSTVAFNYYVTDNSQWKTISDYKTIKSNQIRFNKKSKSEFSSRDTLQLINPLWFFAIFILCYGYLLLAPKL